MNQKTKLLHLFAVILSLALGLASFTAMAKNDNANKSDNSGKTSQSQGKNGNNAAGLKNFEKPDETKGETNAQIHKEKSEEVAKTLKEVADEEKTAGNTEVGDQIQQVATEQEKTQEQTAAAMGKVENRGKIKTFLVGTDYKNLGQLRSNLVQNRNQIRKLTQTLNRIKTEGEKALIQEQLQTLMQERERIKTVITANENDFSLFGWVSRFLNNYEQTPINEQEETQLTDEVEDAIDNVATETVSK